MDHLPRKLAAILYADVAGYSRLTGEDEEGTHLNLRQALEHIVNHPGADKVWFTSPAAIAEHAANLAPNIVPGDPRA